MNYTEKFLHLFEIANISLVLNASLLTIVCFDRYYVCVKEGRL